MMVCIMVGFCLFVVLVIDDLERVVEHAWLWCVRLVLVWHLIYWLHRVNDDLLHLII